MRLPYHCHDTAVILPRFCHAIATLLPCYNHAIAMLAPQPRHAIAMLLPCNNNDTSHNKQPQPCSLEHEPCSNMSPPEPSRGAEPWGAFVHRRGRPWRGCLEADLTGAPQSLAGQFMDVLTQIFRLLLKASGQHPDHL